MADTPTPAEAHATAVESMHVDTVETAPLVVAKEGADPAPEPTPAPVAAADPAPADPAAEGTRKPPEKVPEWMQKKMDDMAAKARLAEKEAKRLAEENAALKAPKPTPAATPAPADTVAAEAAAPPGGYKTKAEFDAAVAAEANNRAANERAATRQKEFDTKSNSAVDAGKTAFGADFDTAIQNLFTVGLLPVQDQATGQVSNDEILAMVLETEDPAKVLFELGSDPAKAAEFLGMTPAKRAMEIAKLSVVPAKKAEPTPLSNAPRPIVPVNGAARASAGPSDNDDDATFFAKREAELKAAGRW